MRIADERPLLVTKLPIGPSLIPDTNISETEALEQHEHFLADLFVHVGVTESLQQARRLLSHFGSLNAVLQADREGLKFADIHDQFLCQLLQKLQAILEARDYEELAVTDPILTPKALRTYALRQMKGSGIVRGIALFFDRKCRPLGNKLIYNGTNDHVEIFHCEVLRKAICLRASHVATLCSNPAGDTKPNGTSIRNVHDLRDKLAEIRISFLDHVIVAGNEASGFREMGLL